MPWQTRLPAERSFPAAVLGPLERAPLAREDRIRIGEDVLAIIWLQHNRRVFPKCWNIFVYCWLLWIYFGKGCDTAECGMMTSGSFGGETLATGYLSGIFDSLGGRTG
jgi:hypothetical protein